MQFQAPSGLHEPVRALVLDEPEELVADGDTEVVEEATGWGSLGAMVPVEALVETGAGTLAEDEVSTGRLLDVVDEDPVPEPEEPEPEPEPEPELEEPEPVMPSPPNVGVPEQAASPTGAKLEGLPSYSTTLPG